MLGGGGYIQLTPLTFAYYLGVGLGGGAVCKHAMFKFQSANTWLSGSNFMERNTINLSIWPENGALIGLKI